MSPALEKAVAEYRRARAAERELFRSMTRSYRQGHDSPKAEQETYWRLQAEATRLSVTAHTLFAQEHLDAGL